MKSPRLNRATLHRLGVLTIDLMGSVGCGKTALLEATLRRLQGKLNIAVFAGDLATTRDAERLARWCPRVIQINTGRRLPPGCQPGAPALARLDTAGLDLLVIENVGNLICPVGFDLGQDIKVGMFAVSEGDDKPAKHPYMVTEAAPPGAQQDRPAAPRAFHVGQLPRRHQAAQPQGSAPGGVGPAR